MHIACRFASLLLLTIPLRSLAFQTNDGAAADKPVKAIADRLLPVTMAKGKGSLPVYVTLDGSPADFSHAQPAVVRALLVFHGKQRNADDYNQSGLRAIKQAGDAGKGTLLITPQFLEKVDTDQFRLPPGILRWGPEQWMAGDNAIDSALSSFDAIDAILVQLGDRKIFPNLKTVVVAGHSGGGQVVQRYAVVGRGGDALMHAGVHVRYVIANPSSYVYFSPERPVLAPGGGEFTYAPPAKTCFGRYDRWKYGIHDPPPYLDGIDFTSLEQRYIHRDVLYLLGTNDVDPNHPALDKTCSGEDEGPYRFFRGKAYFRYLENRHPELAEAPASQQLWFVPGVEHDGDKMLNSACGLAALFSVGTCSTRVFDPKPTP